jgi:hypothetical protein
MTSGPIVGRDTYRYGLLQGGLQRQGQEKNAGGTNHIEPPALPLLVNVVYLLPEFLDGLKGEVLH